MRGSLIQLKNIRHKLIDIVLSLVFSNETEVFRLTLINSATIIGLEKSLNIFNATILHSYSFNKLLVLVPKEAVFNILVQKYLRMEHRMIEEPSDVWRL